MNMAYVCHDPYFKEIISSKEEMAAALNGILLFNTTPHGFILGINAAMEEEMFWMKILKLEQSIVLKPR